MSIGQELLVLGVKRYSFTNEGSGEIVEGTRMEYIEGFEYPFDESNMKGIFVMNVTAPYVFFEKVDKVPAYYNVVFRQRPGAGGKPVQVPVDLQYLRGF